MFDLNIVKENSVVKEIIYGKIGKGISYGLNTSVSVGTMLVNITNNELTDIKVELIKYNFS